MDDYIIEKTKQLKEQFCTSNPFEILEQLGVEVKYNYEFTKLKAFYYVMLGKPYVVINGNMDEHQLKTVAAHELGHHLFHAHLAENSPIKEMGFYDYKSGPEYEANVFAANLLIDDEELESMIKDEADFYCLASCLEVMPELLAFKMKSFNKNKNKYNVPITVKSSFLAE